MGVILFCTDLHMILRIRFALVFLKLRFLDHIRLERVVTRGHQSWSWSRSCVAECVRC